MTCVDGDKTRCSRHAGVVVVEGSLLVEVWLDQCDSPGTARCVEKLQEAQGHGFINKPSKGRCRQWPSRCGFARGGTADVHPEETNKALSVSWEVSQPRVASLERSSALIISLRGADHHAALRMQPRPPRNTQYNPFLQTEALQHVTGSGKKNTLTVLESIAMTIISKIETEIIRLIKHLLLDNDVLLAKAVITPLSHK